MGAACTLAGLALAHIPGEQWALVNEYPATSLPGEGDAFFARIVADKLHGKLSVVTMPDAKLGYKSTEQLKAVAEGKVAMANTFGGAIGDEHPVFAFSSLPFMASDIARARELYDRARPTYEAVFTGLNQKLLYSTPWPPSGIWAKGPIRTPADEAKLRIRTYDKTGTELFKRLGAQASVVSFADLPPRLAAGEIDAVLSSGDGGAGRKLWEYLPHFTAINYAIPLSFTTVNLDKWKSLDEPARAALEAAGRQTEARQWQALEGRLAVNYARMRENGVTITSAITPALSEQLQKAARVAHDDWKAKAGPEGSAWMEVK